MNFVYNSGATMSSAPVRYSYIGIYDYYNYPSSAEIINGSTIYSMYTTGPIGSLYYLKYYNTSGVLTTQQTNYGPAYSTSQAS